MQTVRTVLDTASSEIKSIRVAGQFNIEFVYIRTNEATLSLFSLCSSYPLHL